MFSAHFGQLGIILIWLSGMYFHGARFSNYEAWLSDPIHIKPSAQVVWPIVGQEILNGDVWHHCCLRHLDRIEVEESGHLARC